MIGNRIRKKCTKALITALTSQINGGNAITPGLSDDASDSAIYAGEDCQATNDFPHL